MKKLLQYGWLVVHLTLIVLINAVGTYNLLHRHTSPAPSSLDQLLGQTAVRYYGRFTGAEHGFGFFGLNVRTNGVWLGESNGRVLPLLSDSFETSLRLFSMGNAITDDLLEQAPDTTSPRASYRTLLLRNIACTLRQQHALPDTALVLSYNLVKYPTLAQYRQGQPGQYTLSRFLTAHFTFHRHDNQSYPQP